jgi:trk system potassium uptake protein TrkA
LLAVIVGCGKMGSMVANYLSGAGTSVIIIDYREESFRALTTDFSGFQVVGDATQLEVLKQAKLEQADILLSLTGDDNVNLAISQIGKHYFKLKRSIARVFDPERESIFQKLGIETSCPIRLSVEQLLKSIGNKQEENTVS